MKLYLLFAMTISILTTSCLGSEVSGYLEDGDVYDNPGDGDTTAIDGDQAESDSEFNQNLPDGDYLEAGEDDDSTEFSGDNTDGDDLSDGDGDQAESDYLVDGDDEVVDGDYEGVDGDYDNYEIEDGDYTELSGDNTDGDDLADGDGDQAESDYLVDGDDPVDGDDVIDGDDTVDGDDVVDGDEEQNDIPACTMKARKETRYLWYDMSVTTYVYYEYDEQGRLLVSKGDSGADGTITSITTRTYTDKGSYTLKTVTSDFENDGEIDRCGLAAINADGNYIWSGADGNCDGVSSSSDNLFCYEYDGDGNMIWDGDNNNCNGIRDTQCTEYEYDEYGNQIRWQLYPDCENPDNNEYCYILVLNEFNKPLTSKTDYSCDGSYETNCITNTYDERGNLLTTQNETDCNGDVDDDCRTYQYDDCNNVIYYTSDHNCDGDPTSAVYSYEIEYW